MKRALLLGVALVATPAAAQTITLKPIVDARLRYEGVDQDGFAREADSVTLRLRSGVTATTGPWSALVEAEGTLGIVNRYNSTTNGNTRYPVVADPQNIDLNRIQLQYKGIAKSTVTLGRQRINLDDQRFVGTVLWRQNEQTYDAVRVETAALGPLVADVTYSWSTRSIYGIDSPLQAIGGDNVFAQLGTKQGPLAIKGFAYLIDQDEVGRRQFSSQTYGLRAAATFPLAKDMKLGLIGSYARQSDYASNPGNYRADYWFGEAALGVKHFTVTGGYEVLGSGFQTPLATLHKFNGWADKFLVTPVNGLRDAYASLGYTGPVSALIAWHHFESDRLSQNYGDEWNAQIGWKATKHTALLVKYADYNAKRFATDTRKLWLQLDYTL